MGISMLKCDLNKNNLKKNNVMGRLKPDMRNLSQGEADTIVSIVKKVLDVIVDMTGGKPTFGGKK